MKNPTSEDPQICWDTSIKDISSMRILSKGLDIAFHDIRSLL
jgi:hypothetical protein